MVSGTHNMGSVDFPTLTEAATTIMTLEELQNLRRNLLEEKIEHAKYIRAHPEIDAVMRKAVKKLFMERPSDPVNALLEFFAYSDLTDALHPTEEEELKLKKAAFVQHARGVTRAWPA